ncbi:hypothetical protein [Mucisphaera sp.]|uniref:hypothetical protein n=1 Tax=Mucisphaera sp. TaxID=2913024 RepID=UPI003D0EF632
MILPTLLALLVTLTLFACAATPQPQDTSPTLDQRHQRIRAFILNHPDLYHPGGLQVLDTAHAALQQKHANGQASLVGLEDLWAHSLQEALTLFKQPNRLWGKTTAEETADMIGQTTIGPWQITVTNIRQIYGPPYGVDPDWTNAQIYAFCRDRPEVQAHMIIDYIQRSYEQFGQRSPYAIQRYFWLEPFVRGELGQASDWTTSVVAKPPPGQTWQDLTPAMKADTGFYAKQILMGAPYTDTGLLFWLHVSGDTHAITQTLRTWRDQPRIVANDDASLPNQIRSQGITYAITHQPGHFAIQPEDLRFYNIDPSRREPVRQLIQQVLDENTP